MTDAEHVNARLAALEYLVGATLKMALDERDAAWVATFRDGMVEGVNDMTDLSPAARGQVRLLIQRVLLPRNTPG